MKTKKEIEQRLAELDKIVESAESIEAVDAAKEERKQLMEQLEEMEKLEQRKAQAKALERGFAAGRPVEPAGAVVEVRNTKKYIDAYAEYLKTGEDAECRALLTENVPTTGTIAVPDFVYDIIKTNWEKNQILKYVKKLEVAGNMKVQFEISGTDAVVHDEGSGAVSEETLTEGIVTMVPKNVIKWVSFSKEVMKMRGEAFVRYIYDELSYRIFKQYTKILIDKICALDTTGSASAPKQAAITMAPALATVATAVANLSDEAEKPIIIMNKLTWSLFKAAQYSAGYNVDPFEGLEVQFSSALPAYSSASTDDIYMLVGDLAYGTLANFPTGEKIDFTFDEITRKKEAMVEVSGDEYGAIDVIACMAFCQVKKPASL